MDDGTFHDAALVLVAHGSTTNAESSAPTYQHADELRQRGIFGQVLECFWKLEPGIAGVLRGVILPRAFVVPLFISDGYFTEEVIPRELGLAKGTAMSNGKESEPAGWRHQNVGELAVFYTEPVGTHAAMTDVLLARARGVVAKHPFPLAPPTQDITLFIAGHGTSQNENSRRAIEQQVELVRARHVYAEVHGVFMEEEPRIEHCYTLAATRNVVVVPFFISDGLHSQEDIPVLLGESQWQVRERLRAGLPTWRNPTEKSGRRVWYSAAVGTEPSLADVVLERVRAAVGGELV